MRFVSYTAKGTKTQAHDQGNEKEIEMADKTIINPFIFSGLKVIPQWVIPEDEIWVSQKTFDKIKNDIGPTRSEPTDKGFETQGHINGCGACRDGILHSIHD